MAIKISGMVSGLDTDAMVQELVSAYSKKTEKYEKEKTKMEWKQEAWKELNTKIYSLYSKTVSNMRWSSAYNKKKTSVSDESKVSVTAGTGAVKGTQTLEINKLATSGYLTGKCLRGKGEEKLSAISTLRDASIGAISANTSITITVGGEDKKIDLKPDMSISELTEQLKGAGINANFDEENQRFFLSSTDTGADKNFQIKGDEDILKGLGLSTNDGAIKMEGEDAQIKVNGAEFTSSSNTFSINGMTISAKELTETGKPVKLVTDTDVDAIYDNIKSFVKEYNELINEMDSLYNAEKAKGYEPLTDEEKEALSDEEVEKWEKKIKDSLLRRDSTLSSLGSAMKTVMKLTFDVDGETMSLSNFGIGTANYFTSEDNKKNALHIDGDEEDDISSSNEDKLRAMIASDPDKVQDFFTQLATKLYDELGNKMKSTTLSSAFTVYNDKQMKDELEDLDDKIDKWEDYVTEQEDYWYRKFTEMETALSKLQSQTSALSGLLGM